RWRGNIRELRNTVERMIIMTGGDTIDLADLPESVRSPATWSGGGGTSGLASPKSASAEGSGETKAGTLREVKENAEPMFLVGKLRENGWDISQTAGAIGETRRHVYK